MLIVDGINHRASFAKATEAREHRGHREGMEWQ